MARPPGVGNFEYKGRKDGLCLVGCWCHADLVLVAPEVLRAGLTGSCGADDCSVGWEPPAEPVEPPRRTRRGLWAILDTPQAR